MLFVVISFQQPEVVMDPLLELSVNQTEATPLPTEATNDCSGDGGDTEGQENENGLKEHQEMFSARDVPPLAGMIGQSQVQKRCPTHAHPTLWHFGAKTRKRQ